MKTKQHKTAPVEHARLPGRQPCSASRRALILAGMAVPLACATWRASAAAQPEWPQRAVRIIVPYPPGGAIDAMIRYLAPRLEAGLGQSVVIENRSGAGGIVGTEAAARAGDQHTLLMTALTHVTAPAITPGVSYDAVRDFTAVAPVAIVPNVVVVPAASPFKTLADVMAAAKKEPGTLTYGSAGLGSSLHLTAALFASQAGLDITHVPYRGSGPAIIDLISGRLDMMFDSTTSSAPHIQKGTLRALAVATPERITQYPDLPTIAQATGLAYGVNWWFALLAPKDIPEAGQQRVAQVVHDALRDPTVVARFNEMGIQAMTLDRAGLQKQIIQDNKTWGETIKKLDIKA